MFAIILRMTDQIQPTQIPQEVQEPTDQTVITTDSVTDSAFTPLGPESDVPVSKAHWLKKLGVLAMHFPERVTMNGTGSLPESRERRNRERAKVGLKPE